MGITYGDHLIDTGYYDITPEQEKEMEDAEKAPLRLGKYTNLVDNKVYVIISEDDGFVSFHLDGRDTAYYLGREEFERRFRMVESDIPAPVAHLEGTSDAS